jgi:hypothetical protein
MRFILSASKTNVWGIWHQKNRRKKFMKRIETAKEQKKRTTSSKKREAKENNRRSRGGICWLLLVGLGAWDLAEIEAMSPDEINGTLEMWPENDMDPRFLDDHIITIGNKWANAEGRGIELDQADGLPIIYAMKGVAKIFKIFTKLARAALPATTNAFYSDIKNAGALPKAPQKPIDAAKKSDTIAKIIKDQRFLDCLPAAPLAFKIAGKVKRADPPLSFDMSTCALLSTGMHLETATRFQASSTKTIRSQGSLLPTGTMCSANAV